jgi:poly(hydroxyalkanoate) depolymerase family esterase
MWRALKRWLSNARAALRRLRLGRNEGRFEAPHRRLVSRLLLTFRAYRLYLPAAATRRDRLPLLVMLHGCKQDAEVFAEGTRMNEIAERNHFIVVYPEQSRTANAYGCWNWFHPAAQRGAGDAGAVARIVRRVTKRYPVDATRVYVAGMSAGGALAAVLAHSHGDLFAACAVHSGLRHGAATSAATAMSAMRNGAPDPRPETAYPGPFVPTLVIHGDHDTTVDPVNAGQIIEQARLAAANGAPARALLESTRRVASASRPYEQRDYVRDGKVVLRLIAVEDLDHAWSGGDGRHPFNDPEGPDASRLIWDFVKDFRRLPDGSHAWRRSFSLSAIWDWLRRSA